MADITMSLDDTLELDAVIKEWNDPSNIVEDSDGKFNLSGFYTGTRVLDPQESGKHTIKVNGQELTVKVTDPSTIPESTLTQDLVAWYRFENGDVRDYTATLDATFADSTAYDGTVNGATFQSNSGVTDFENGSNSGAFSFSRNTDYLDLSNTGFGTQSFSEISIGGWANISETTSSSGYFYLWANESGTQNELNGKSSFIIRYRDGDGFEFYTYNNDSSVSIDVNVSRGGWQHLFLTNDSNTFDVYVDGVKEDSVDSNGSTNNLNLGYIGNYDKTTDRSGSGNIDDCRLYDRALTDSEINDIYNETKP